MLSDKSRPVIQATLPVVGAHIQEIAQCFYRHLFTTHPELLNGTFNRGNQAHASQQQALAGAVAAFATALVKTPDHLPENLLARIAQKHRSRTASYLELLVDAPRFARGRRQPVAILGQ